MPGLCITEDAMYINYNYKQVQTSAALASMRPEPAQCMYL